jgi:4-hydroxybenzoate polyprenyltransferase
MTELANSIKKINIFERLSHFILLLRLSHWSKAVFVLLGCVYSTAAGYFPAALCAALAFCLISSAVYIYNDIQDRTEDSLHPHKCRRPIASDRILVSEAVTLLFLLLIVGLLLAFFISKQLLIILTLYLTINLAYNHVLKLMPIWDVACIATGFMLRVLAGTVGIGLPISAWLTITATLLSFFIALNKRRLEMNLDLSHVTRTVLKKYHPVLLHWLIISTAAACFAMYFFYTVYARDESFYFMLTLPFAAFALWRFSWLSAQDCGHDDPINVFLMDRLSRLNLWCFMILTFMALRA